MLTTKRDTIRNHSAEANLFARRALIAFIGVVVMLIILFSNIYSLEVSSYQKYKTSSNQNRIKLMPVAPNRGLIYDRNGVLLAENRPVYSLAVIPEQADDLGKSVQQVSELLDISQERQDKFFSGIHSRNQFKTFELKSRLTEQQVALFSVNQHKYPGFFINAQLKRHYPFGDLTTHSLGYVGKIHHKEFNKLQEKGFNLKNNNNISRRVLKNYFQNIQYGKLGLEKYYEDILQGSIGHQEVEVNNQGRIIRTLNYTPPVPGKDLTLSLDIELQMVAKRALSGKRGAVVAIDPRDGGVLALYSNPTYDGNLFVHGISSTNYKKLLNSKNLPLINRALQGYPPASTIKPLLALTGLQEKLITEKTKIWDPGWYQLEGVENKRRDWKEQGHGWVNLTKSMEQSCNVYYYDLAYKLGISRISNMMEKFGFGDYTGIDLHEESRAILPSVEWKRARYNKPWYTGETLSVGIGQSYWTVTPLQLAQATSILVNKGEIKVPHFLKSIRETSHTTNLNTNELEINVVDKPFKVDQKAPIKLDKTRYWDLVLDAMHNTVQKPGATAYNAFAGSQYDAAGKTGSAQVASIKQDEKYDAKKTQERKRDNAMFIAFAPYENPEIVVAVAIENVAQGGGGTNAAPVARQIMDQYFGDRVIESKNRKLHPMHRKMYRQKKVSQINPADPANPVNPANNANGEISRVQAISPISANIVTSRENVEKRILQASRLTNNQPLINE